MHILESDDTDRERRFVQSASGWRSAGGKKSCGAASFKVRSKPEPIDDGLVFFAYLRGCSDDGRPYVEKYDFEFEKPFCRIYRSGQFEEETLDFRPIESNIALESVRLDGEDMPKNRYFRKIYEYILQKHIEAEMLEAE